MKKVLCILAAIAMVTVFSTSCNKNCTCKTYDGGQVVATSTFENPDKKVKCSSYTLIVTEAAGKSGIECK